ncbi:diguanylate cyclase [Pseudidiomarina terrestris]|uniref:diguanylate cyclase n=1 Tax=Pseudidiomarina terrestris TaxID=2820060 RepID=A0ABT8MHL5_9GAMM|nr:MULTISPECIES: diguanylate cyclase [unclassified Pseudidiomarina]MDN7129448.1 diguanylate cyclase [Pseudidiomarina sp. 1APR75-15]MDN7134287.1 diguanylate cyclase [Pseudidiomarina sp. 1ASP75-5]MDN7137025.1 diguanylate cyclase [Pseudidiomarina sp. 1ASP75-14]
MGSVPLPTNEQARLQLLHQLDILDTEADPIFDRITALVKEVLGADAALITLVDEERQWFKAKVGFDEPETPREVSFCTHVVAAGETVIVENAIDDERFSENPYVTAEGGVRSYAGAPITLYNDYHLGSLCVISQTPYKFPPSKIRYLEVLAEWVSETITARYELENYHAEQQVLAHGPVCAVVWRVEPDVHLSYVAENAERVLGYGNDYLLREDVNYESIVHPDEREELLSRMHAVLDGDEDILEMDYRVVGEQDDSTTIRWIHHYARVDKDTEGNVLRVRGYLLDDSKGKELELALLEANQNFELALAAGEFFNWSWTIPTDKLTLSHSWWALAGYTAEQERQLDWRTLVHPDDIEKMQEQMSAHAKGVTHRFDARFRVRHRAGHYLWLHSVGKIIARDAQGRPLKMMGIHHDITQLIASEKVLEQQAEVLELVSHVQNEFMLAKNFSEVCDFALPKLMTMTDSKVGFIGELPAHSQQRNLVLAHGLRLGSIEHKSESMQQLIQQSLEVEVGGDVLRSVLVRGEPEFYHEPLSEQDLTLKPLVLPDLNNALVMPLYFKRDVVGLMVLANTDGHYRQEYLGLLRPMLDTLGTLMHMRRMDEERRQAVEELRKLATTDELTGVANRRVFWEAMSKRFDEFKRYQVPMTVAVIDLDHFKSVNDNYGHAAGDQVLREFCHRAEKQLRDMDLFGRLGGEEFAILFTHTEVDAATTALERIRKAIAEKSFKVEGEEISVTISAGIAEVRKDDEKLDHWMARADEALYKAKAKGRNQCVTVTKD